MQTSLHQKRGSNKSVCPVRSFEIYFNICKLIGIKLAPGFLFRSVTKSNSVSSVSLRSAAAQGRLKTYISVLGKHFFGDHFTIHSFRSGAAVSLALEGVSLHEIMDHWVGKVVGLFYTTLSSNRLSTLQEWQLD